LRDTNVGLEVGFEAIDREHIVQVELLDTLHEAIRAGRGATEVAELLERLVDYSQVHFLSEQLLMRLHAYPDYEPHLQEHDRMIQSLGRLRSRIVEAGVESTLPLLDTLREDLLAHIRRQDRQLGSYLADSKIGRPQG
jgi:hemerythrin